MQKIFWKEKEKKRGGGGEDGGLDTLQFMVKEKNSQHKHVRPNSTVPHRWSVLRIV